MAIPQFPTTKWSIVAMLTESQDHAAVALESFCQQYRRPLLVFVESLGVSVDEAEDTLHDFLLHFIAKEGFRSASPQGGRLRSFLMVSLKNFAISERIKKSTQKRGGGKELLSLESSGYDASAPEDWQQQMEKAFDRQWANAIMDTVMEKLRAEYRGRNRFAWFDQLSTYLHWDPGRVDYSKPAKELGVNSSRVALEVFRLRKRFTRLLREEIARTVRSPEQVEDELHYLARVVEVSF